MGWENYKTAVVEIHGADGAFVVGPHMALGRREVAAPPAGEVWWIITAENPNGETTSAEANKVATAALRRDLEQPGWTVLDAVGGDLDWEHTEQSLVVVGPSEEEALDLGRKYGQQAIFGWDDVRWLLLSCTDGRRESRQFGAFRGPARDLRDLDEFEDMKAGAGQPLDVEPVTWWEIRSHLQSRLMMDAPWLVEHDYGMTWWPTVLPMVIEVRESGMYDETDNWLRVHAETPIATTTDEELGLALVAEHADRFPMGAFLYEDGVLKLSSVLTLNPRCRSMLVPFHTAVLMQAAVAYELGRELVEIEGVSLPPDEWVTHPASGVRTGVDELVNIHSGGIMETLRTTPWEAQALWDGARPLLRERMLARGWEHGFSNEEVDFFNNPTDPGMDVAVGMNLEDWRTPQHGQGLTVWARILEHGAAFDDPQVNAVNVDLRREFTTSALGWLTGGENYRGETKPGSVLNWYFPQAAIVEAGSGGTSDYEVLVVAVYNFVHHASGAARSFRDHLRELWIEPDAEPCAVCGASTQHGELIYETWFCEPCSAAVRGLLVTAPWLDFPDVLHMLRNS